MPKFWHVVDDSRHQSADQQVAEFRRVLGVDRTDLYSESGLGFESPEALNRTILKTVASARERPEPIESMGTLIESRLTSYIREFRKTFPDPFRTSNATFLSTLWPRLVSWTELLLSGVGCHGP